MIMINLFMVLLALSSCHFKKEKSLIKFKYNFNTIISGNLEACSFKTATYLTDSAKC